MVYNLHCPTSGGVVNPRRVDKVGIRTRERRFFNNRYVCGVEEGKNAKAWGKRSKSEKDSIKPCFVRIICSKNMFVI